jgi:hypothetical protein
MSCHSCPPFWVCNVISKLPRKRITRIRSAPPWCRHRVGSFWSLPTYWSIFCYLLWYTELIYFLYRCLIRFRTIQEPRGHASIFFLVSRVVCTFSPSFLRWLLFVALCPSKDILFHNLCHHWKQVLDFIECIPWFPVGPCEQSLTAVRYRNSFEKKEQLPVSLCFTTMPQRS